MKTKRSNCLKAASLGKSYSLKTFGVTATKHGFDQIWFRNPALDFTGARKNSVLMQRTRKQDC